jgi:hypothetical protein
VSAIPDHHHHLRSNTMASIVFKIFDGKFGLTLVDPTVTDPCTATIDDYSGTDAFSCQITSGQLTASPNVTTETVPSTWCQPEESVPQVGVTSFSLDMTFLQDPQISTGLSRFLFEHDTELAWFFMGLDGDNPPKAVGQVRLVAGAIGGAGRVALTATVSLPCDSKPDVCFGDATTSAPVTNLFVAGAQAVDERSVQTEADTKTKKTPAAANA